MAFISVRNVHLSDRARSNVHELLYKSDKLGYEEKVKRSMDLDRQNKAFIDRYMRTSRIFRLVLIAFSVFLVGYLLASGCEDQTAEPMFREISGFCCIVGIAILFIAFYGLVMEFSLGKKTLKINNKVLKRRRWQACK